MSAVAELTEDEWRALMEVNVDRGWAEVVGTDEHDEPIYRLTPAWGEVMRELVELGFARVAGERHGQPAYAITRAGKRHLRDVLDA